VRNIIGSPQYACLFDTQLAEDSQARGKWHTRDGGMYYAVGIGGSIMGHGADVALIDDPFENMEAGQSELQRKRVWDWYTGTLYNRLQPNGAIVIINHSQPDSGPPALPICAKDTVRHPGELIIERHTGSLSRIVPTDLAQQKPCFFLPPAPRNRSRISGWRDIHANLNI
jgi:hypothetical protein